MFFSQEKASLEQKNNWRNLLPVLERQPRPCRTLWPQNQLFDKTGGIFKASSSSSNCPGKGRRDISQHIPIPSEARTAGPATSCAFTLVTLGPIPLPFGKWCLYKIWNLENGLDASPGTCSGSWGCSSLVQNHPGSRALSELGLSLQDTINMCTDIYIYICLFTFLWHIDRLPAAAPSQWPCLG